MGFILGDIKELLQYIFDKPNTYKELYELIQYDDSLSVPMRKNVLGRVSAQYAKDCDNTLLQANALNTYGYYLNLADRKEEALKMMQAGIALLAQLDDDGIFYYDKYRAVINYADLLFSLGKSDEAIQQVSAAESSLHELELQDTEVYADCVYSLGLYHLCLNDTSAGDELVSAFRIFIDLYGRDSDFVQTRAAELQSYIETAHINLTDYEPLKQLLGE